MQSRRGLRRCTKPLLYILLTSTSTTFGTQTKTSVRQLSKASINRRRNGAWNKSSPLLSVGFIPSSRPLLSRVEKHVHSSKMATMDSPSAERNKEPIWSVLSRKVLPKLGSEDRIKPKALNVLEIAAGAGVHTLHFTSKLSQEESEIDVRWRPSDPDGPSLDSIRQRISELPPSLSSRACILAPIPITLVEDGMVQEEDSKRIVMSDAMDLMICINMIHISPWEATVGLMKLASQILRSGGILYCYGPYIVGGNAVESNWNFDMSLRARNPSWGVRNLEQVVALAQDCGLSLVETVEMPANNLSVIFRKT